MPKYLIGFAYFWSMAEPRVAIVILNWNGRAYLEKFLPSVVASSYSNKEIIVADNGSTDDSRTFLIERFPQVRLIALNQNFGFSGGYNRAVKQVSAEYLILLNSDVEVTPGWIEPLIDLMVKDQTIGACQPKMLSYTDRSRFEYAGAAGGWLDSLGYPFARGRIFEHCETDHGQYDDAAPIFWASGAALLVRAELYAQSGGLDEYFFAHQEEIDFCWRLQLQGNRIYACPQSVVYHLGGGTLKRGDERKVFLNYRNNLVMLAKHLPRWQLVGKLPVRFALDNASAWKLLLSGKASFFWAIFRAHMAFLGWCIRQKYLPDRTRLGKRQLEGWYRGSIVWKHFIGGLNNFQEIINPKK
jgi:GT2 family glycosyltransferase